LSLRVSSLTLTPAILDEKTHTQTILYVDDVHQILE